MLLIIFRVHHRVLVGNQMLAEVRIHLSDVPQTLQILQGSFDVRRLLPRHSGIRDVLQEISVVGLLLMRFRNLCKLSVGWGFLRDEELQGLSLLQVIPLLARWGFQALTQIYVG